MNSRTAFFSLILATGIAGVPSLLESSVAFADMIPPGPKCAPGEVAERSHRGSTCVAAPPKNCPAGWTGVNGGRCVLHTCDSSSGCDDDRVCKPIDLCVDERTLPMYQRDSPVGTRKAFVYSDLCTASCVAPAQCRPSGVCLPKNIAKPAARPKNGAEGEGVAPRGQLASPPTSASASASASTTSTPPASSVDAATKEPPPVASSPVVVNDAASADNAPKDTAPHSGGCSGCDLSASSPDRTGWFVACVSAVAIAIARSMCRRKKARS